MHRRLRCRTIPIIRGWQYIVGEPGILKSHLKEKNRSLRRRVVIPKSLLFPIQSRGRLSVGSSFQIDYMGPYSEVLNCQDAHIDSTACSTGSSHWNNDPDVWFRIWILMFNSE